MELVQSTELRQELFLSTELQQGIAILQMSAIDLSEHVKQCVEENPFLDDSDWEWPQHTQPASEFKQTISVNTASESMSSAPEGGKSANRSDKDFADFLAQEDTLADSLVEQLHLSTRSPAELRIGEFIIDSLDENGYLRISVEEVAHILGFDVAEASCALRIVQHMEPAGIAARNLSECLAIQLEARGALEGPVRKILEGGLPEFGKASPDQIAKEKGVTLEEIDVALDILRTCDPRPGAQFKKASGTIWPEVIVEHAEKPEGAIGTEVGIDIGCSKEGGGYYVHLQDFFLPHLKINDRYRTMAKTERNKETEKYLKRKLSEAESLVGNIRYRKEALLKIACCIVELQQDYLDKGIDFMHSLTLETVASLTGYSKSTVSRIANGNYMQTPRGVFELRYFFQPPATGDGMSAIAQASVKHRLVEMIRTEDPHNPLSDQEIADRLEKESIPISRRTVGKYRAELDILPRSLRKRA